MSNSPPENEPVPAGVKGGTDTDAPDLSEYPEAARVPLDECCDPLAEGDADNE